MFIHPTLTDAAVIFLLDLFHNLATM